MNNITRESVTAFNNALPFKKSNMEVTVLPNVTVMKLNGNIIAYQYNDPERTLSITTCGLDSNTLKERLNALNRVKVSKVDEQWFLNGKMWNGKLIDVK